MALMGHEKISTTMAYYRIPQKRRREAAQIVGNLVIDGDHLTIRSMAAKHRLADERATIAVPFGKCSNPQNVAAEGYGCPIRHQCFGCASFGSDPSYLPEMRRRLLDLKAMRARIDAFDGAAEWAKRDARPSDEEIEALQHRIRAEEKKTNLPAPHPNSERSSRKHPSPCAKRALWHKSTSHYGVAKTAKTHCSYTSTIVATPSTHSESS